MVPAPLPASRIKLGLLFLGAVGLVLLCHHLPCRYLTDTEAFSHYIHQQGLAGIGVFIAAQVGATAIGLPGTLMVIAGGAVFGVVWGTLWSTLSSTIGAVLAFLMARYLLQDWVRQRWERYPLMQRLDCLMHQNSFNCVLAMRFVPIAPFNLINFLFGLTPIDLKSYTLGTFVGIVPGTLLYTGLGASGRRALQGEGWLPFAIVLGTLTLLSLLPLMMRSRSKSG